MCSPFVRPLLILAMLSLSACQIAGWDDSSETRPADGELVLSYGTSFGECIGYCQTELTLTAASITYTLRSQVTMQPDRRYVSRMPPGLWRDLTARVAAIRFEALDDVYGCPDCADGGAEWVEVHEGLFAKRVTFEYRNAPEPLGALTEDLRAMAESYRDDR